MAHILHIDLHDFLVAVERKHDPTLIGRPVVIGGQPTGWGRVVAVSQEAADRGVKPGMSLSVAASRCPAAIFLDGAFDRYLDASAAIDERLREAGVPVEWTSIDSVFLDLTPGPSASLRGAAAPAPRALAERLQTALRDQLGFETACGIASTKIAAQIASRLARPAGLLFVLPGYEERLMAPLDVAMLPDLPPGLAPRLQRAGVLRLGHLAAMDLQTAEGLLGRRAAEFARLARGLDERAVDGTAPPRSIAREVTLPQPTQSPAELESVAQYLTETLAGRLRRMGCFAQTITVRLRSGAPERDAPGHAASTHSATQSAGSDDARRPGAGAEDATVGGVGAEGRGSKGGSKESSPGHNVPGCDAPQRGPSEHDVREPRAYARGMSGRGTSARGLSERGHAGRDLAERTVARSTTLREATATDADLVAAAHALVHVLRRSFVVTGANAGASAGASVGGSVRADTVRHVAGITVVLSNLHQGGAQMPLFPLSPAAATRDAWTDLRGRAGFRALVHGRFATEGAARARRAG